jgi:phosphonate dehydrogenase
VAVPPPLTGLLAWRTAREETEPMPSTWPRVVVTHWVHPSVHDYLAEFSDVAMPTREEGVWPRTRVLDLAGEADGLVACMADRIDAAFLSRCPRLRVVSATLKGYDNFDAQACARHGTWLTIVPDLLIGPTAELAIGLTLGLMRRIAEGDAHVRAGQFAGWRPHFFGASLEGATVGILGMGQLGRAIASRLTGFGPRIIYHDIHRLAAGTEQATGVSFRPLADLLGHSDVVIVSLPLTEKTGGLVDGALLRSVKPGCYLVNVGRGSVVDEEAVASALEAGRLRGYAADVFAMEDWARPGHPRSIPGRLLSSPRTLFTPHLGSAVDLVRRQMSLEAARQVWQVLHGQRPDHAVGAPEPGEGP